MVPTINSRPATYLPSLAKIALAIAIVRAKPPGTSAREYVLQLRSKVKRGQLQLDRRDQGHYLDVVAYWQEQCRNAQHECDRLRSLNMKLERSNHQLSNRTATNPDPGTDSTPQISKRKAPTTTAPPSRAAKRPRVTPQKAVQSTTADTQDTIDDDSEFLEGLGDDGARLVKALFTTHDLCRSTNVDAEALCQSLIRTSTSLGKVISVIAQNYESLSRQGRRTSGASSLDQDKSDSAVALAVCARAFLTVLVGTGKLVESKADARLPSLVVCDLAVMFKSALTSIEVSAKQTVQMASSQPSPPKKSKAKASIDTIRESIAARAVAHLLISFLGFLEKTDPVHQKIFDGFAFVLFERVGQRLYYCTFGRHRSTTTEGNIKPIPEPQSAADLAKREIEASFIRLEVKALILILERAMGLAPNHMSIPSSRSNNTNRLPRTLSLKTLPVSSRAKLSPIAKDRLQRTLVTCMYGSNVNDEFLDVLTKPIPVMRLKPLQNVSRVHDKDVENWYKQEVWRLVGWDILAKESQF